MESIIKKHGAVKAKSNAAQDLRDLFEVELKDIYYAEKALTVALQKMSKNASSPKLITALNDHLDETKEHVSRLEQVFGSMNTKPVAKKCDAIEGLIKECEVIMGETKLGVVRDAGIIAAGQKIEHYEIATYGTLLAYAVTLGENKAEKLLAKTLEEEKKADTTLTKIALSTINLEAVDAGENWKTF